MKLLGQILHAIDLVNEWMGKLFGFLIIILMVAVVYDTCMRYFFASPTLWGMEANQILLLAIVCMGGAYCLLHGGHVRVDVIYMNLNQKTKALLDLISIPLIMLFCIVLIKYGLLSTVKAFTAGEINPEGGWEYPMWPIYMLIPIAGLLMGLQSLAKWIRTLVILVTGENKLNSKVVPGEGGIRN